MRKSNSSIFPDMIAKAAMYFFVLALYLPLYAQTTTINIHGTGMSIKQAFNIIEEQTGYTIAYSQSKLDDQRKIDLDLSNASLQKAFNEILGKDNYSFTVAGTHIILNFNPVNSVIEPEPEAVVAVSQPEVPATAIKDTEAPVNVSIPSEQDKIPEQDTLFPPMPTVRPEPAAMPSERSVRVEIDMFPSDLTPNISARILTDDDNSSSGMHPGIFRPDIDYNNSIYNFRFEDYDTKKKKRSKKDRTQETDTYSAWELTFPDPWIPLSVASDTLRLNLEQDVMPPFRFEDQDTKKNKKRPTSGEPVSGLNSIYTPQIDTEDDNLRSLSEILSTMHPYNSGGYYLAIKSNLLYWGTTTPNIGLEFRISRHWSLDAGGGWNPWNFNGNHSFKHWSVMQETRYWLRETFRGHHFGIHLGYAHYKVGNIFVPERVKNNRYKGYIYGGGLSYGYNFRIGEQWGLDLGLGIGYARIEYDKYYFGAYDYKVSEVSKNYFGPTRAEVTFSYLIK